MPTNPSYATDVRPVLAAHCTRCHGATLDHEHGGAMPLRCHLQMFDDIGDCTADPVNCTEGAHTRAARFKDALVDRPRVPPPPAMLNAWEHEVLMGWSRNPLP